MQYNKISGFSDEIDAMIDVQFDTLNKIAISYFEPRGVDGKNISELSNIEIMNLKRKMENHAIEVSSIGSPIGKIKISDDFCKHYESFKRVVEIAKALGTKYIRMFSFFAEREGEWTQEERSEVFTRIQKMLDYAKANDVILLHENEKGIYGDTADRCLDLMENFYCENFKAVFDPANFVQCGQDTKKAYNMLKKYIAYMHIKDAKFESGEVVPSGYGDGNVEYILNDLFESGYDGFLSLEPHLGSFEGLGKLELGDEMLNLPKSGEGTFTLAFNELNKILEKI